MKQKNLNTVGPQKSGHVGSEIFEKSETQVFKKNHFAGSAFIKTVY